MHRIVGALFVLVAVGTVLATSLLMLGRAGHSTGSVQPPALGSPAAPCAAGCSLWSRGGNGQGQLGDGSNVGLRNKSVQPSSLGSVIAFSAGLNNNALAVKKDGTVWAWGLTGYQGGVGDKLVVAPTSHTPVQVAGLSNMVAVSGGNWTALALRADGTVWAWGIVAYNDSADPRSPAARVSATPVQVAGVSDVVAIAAGQFFNLALRRDGTVWTWGENLEDGLGIPTHIPEAGIDIALQVSNSPVQITGLSDVVAIDAGNAALALRSDGSVWAWGNTLGVGVNQTAPWSAGPIAGLTDVMALASSGWNHSLAVKKDGTVWAWGSGLGGVLANGSTTGTEVKSPILVKGLSDVVAVGATNERCIALEKNGTVWDWGMVSAPVPVDDAPGKLSLAPEQIQGLAGVRAIASGSDFTLMGM